MLTLFLLWLIGCTLIAVLNARYWKICPDMEDMEAMDAKARKIAPIMPQTPIPYSHKVMYVVDMILLIGVSGLVVWLICNAI
jgi:hypothetical protein